MDKEIKLNLVKKIGVTKEVYKILRKEKSKQKKSMAKLVCEIIIQKYGNEKL